MKPNLAFAGVIAKLKIDNCSPHFKFSRSTTLHSPLRRLNSETYPLIDNHGDKTLSLLQVKMET